MDDGLTRAVDVAVIGGGIVGTAAALELASAGASVVLFEATAVGAGASGRNSGAVEHPFDPILEPLYRETVERYRRLASDALQPNASDAPGSFAFPDAPVGLLLVAPEADMATLEAERDAIAAAAPQLAPTILTPTEVARLEPAVASGVVALRLETGYPVPPAAAVRAFARQAEHTGATIRVGEAASLWREGGRVVGVRTAGGEHVAAGAVLVAAGPWSPDIIDPTGTWRPIVRTWGVTVAIHLAAPPRHVLVQSGVGAINRPGETGASRPGEPEGPGAAFESMFTLVTAGGVSVVGSTFLPEEPDPGPVGPLLLQRGGRFVPGLYSVGVDELRACARPQSLDGRPLVGRVPGHENLFIAAGHGPWGISTGPETARLVADLILGRPVAIPAELDPARFA
ncbi:MAG TPA: FAD-dependent oxidoreductase [Methylomirabilota bacterium]|nr:FAD-dependent oxidoreductase [Methylomirabilota bacterium]